MIPYNVWIRDGLKKYKQIDSPKFSSALVVKQNGYGRSVEGHIGHFLNNGNNVYFNGTNVALLSDAFSGKSSYPIIPENFHKVTTLFTARKSIKGTWINDKDEYIIQKENNI